MANYYFKTGLGQDVWNIELSQMENNGAEIYDCSGQPIVGGGEGATLSATVSNLPGHT